MTERSASVSEAEEAFVHEAERQLKETGTPDRVEDAPEVLPAHPGAFVRYFLGFYTWPLAAMGVLEFAQAACQILIPKALQQLIDSATQLAGTGEVSVWTSLQGPIWFFLVLNIGILVFSRSSGAILVMLAPALRRRVRHSLYRYLQSHSQRYFLGNFAGSLANRIGEVSLGVNHSTWTVMFDFWPVTVTLAVSLVLLAQVHAWLALVLGFWTLGYVAVSYVLASRCREYAKAFAATRSAVTGRIVDAVTNVMSAKLFARMEHERSYLRHYLDQEVKAARRTFWFMERMRWFQFVATLSPAGWHDCVCGPPLVGGGHVGGLIRHGGEPAADGDQRRAQSEPAVPRVLRVHRQHHRRRQRHHPAARGDRCRGRARPRGNGRRNPIRERRLRLPGRRACLSRTDADRAARNAGGPSRVLGVG